MKDVVSANNKAKAIGLIAAAPKAGAVPAAPEAGAISVAPKAGAVPAAPKAGAVPAAASETKEAGAVERPSLFCSLDGTCVNPHDAIPLDARDTFARNFMSHFAAALGESKHAA